MPSLTECPHVRLEVRDKKRFCLDCHVEWTVTKWFVPYLETDGKFYIDGEEANADDR